MSVKNVCTNVEQFGETCSSENTCDSGLSCQTCPANGNTRRRCTQIQPINATSKVRFIAYVLVYLSLNYWIYFVGASGFGFGQVKGLPFNNYSWLTTHNSYAIIGTKSPLGSFIISPMNQEDSVTNQLKVRQMPLSHFDAVFSMYNLIFFFFNF